MPRGYTIQEVAQKIDVSAHTLRYYERIGLIQGIERSQNARLYSEDNLRFIGFLKRLRATGMSIQQMQCYAGLLREGDTSLEARAKMLKDHAALVRAQISEMLGYLEVIDEKIGLYQGWIKERKEYETQIG